MDLTSRQAAELLRLCGDQRELIRAKLKREKGLKLKTAPSPGKAFSVEEQERMLAVALASTQAARMACERRPSGGSWRSPAPDALVRLCRDSSLKI